MARTGASPPRRPPVSLRPIPPLDPPFTDEPASDTWLRNRQLALSPIQQPGRAWRSNRHPDPTRPGGRQSSAKPPPLPVEALATATPEAVRAAHRFATTCMEILNGLRPLSQIRPLTHPAHLAPVVEQLARALARLGPVPRRGARPRVQLRILRVCEPRPGAAEAAIAYTGPADRTAAIAFRLERRSGAWTGTALQVI